MLEERYLEEFKKMSLVNRKISKGDELPSLVDRIVGSINYFNSFDEFHYSLEDDAHTSFDKIPILNEFKDFVLPRSVRFEPGNLKTKDLLLRPILDDEEGRRSKDAAKKVSGKFKFDFYSYMMDIHNFRRHFKKDANSDVAMLDVLKKHISFTEALEHIYVEDADGNKFVKSGIDAILPYRLKDDFLNLFEDGYFDSSYDTCVINYMHRINW